MSNVLYTACASKVFDSMSHKSMCEKLDLVAFGMNAISFTKDFLTNRSQHVCVNGTKSDWLNVKQGVPQGKKPELLLILLYVIDMTKNYMPNNEIIQCTDDTLIFASVENPSTASETIEAQIEHLCSFFRKMKLQLNTLRTEFVVISRHAHPGSSKMSIKVGEEMIHANKSFKYLGISMDCDISFQLQNKKTLRNMATFIRTLHQIRKSLLSTTRTVLFKTLALGQMEYPIFLVTGFIQNMDQLPRQAKEFGYQNCSFFADK